MSTESFMVIQLINLYGKSQTMIKVSRIRPLGTKNVHEVVVEIFKSTKVVGRMTLQSIEPCL